MRERACLSTEALGKLHAFLHLTNNGKGQNGRYPCCQFSVYYSFFFHLFIFQVHISTFPTAIVSYIEVRVAVGDGEHSAGVGPLAAAHARAAGRGGGALRAPGTRDRAESALSQGMLLQPATSRQECIVIPTRTHDSVVGYYSSSAYLL